jgi:SHS family lactate transporter-like MFS transporter
MAMPHPLPASDEDRANQRNAVLAGFLGWTLDAFDFFLLTYITADVARAFGRSVPEIAGVIAASLMMRPAGAIVFGLLADRYGRRLPLMLNVIFYAFISVLCGIAPNYGTFLVLRLLFGVGMGGEWGTGAALVLESVSAKWRGLISGLLQEGYAMGNLLAAIAFRTVYVQFHSSDPDNAWRYMFFVGGVPALLSLFIRARVKESEAWHEHRTEWPVYFRSMLGNSKRFGYLVLLMTAMNCISHGTQDLYPTFLQRQRGYAPETTAYIAMVSMAGEIVGGLVFGAYSDRRGRRRAMITSLLMGVVVVPLWIAAPSTALVVVGAFLMQLFVQGAWGVIPAHINELSPGNLRGFLPGFAYQLGVAFAASIVYVEAVLAEYFTYAQSMGVLAAAVFLIGAVVVGLGPEAHAVSFRKQGARVGMIE